MRGGVIRAVEAPSKSFRDRQTPAASLERMHMHVRHTRAGLPGEPIDVPEFGSVRFLVGQSAW